MVGTVPKVTLSSSRNIPFNKLVLSQSNVRRMKAGVSIEALADDIARRTLLQSLNVRPVLDANGGETGRYEVPAGGRRYRALELLVKQKRLAKTALVPCVVREPSADTSAEEDSLAENAHRADLHPLDQFRAFKMLSDQRLSEDDIAARFFVTPAVVKQRLRLAAVSPKLLDVYADDGMTLQQLMAFTVTNDHVRQEQVWDAFAHSYNREPFHIRRQLTEGAVKASDRRALFVGGEAYQAAGGGVLRDLFEDDDGGWLQDPALLDRLVTEKLEGEAESLSAEGWKWIVVAVDFPYGHTNGLRRLTGEDVPLTEAEHATRESLRNEYDRFEEQYSEADELSDDIDQRLGEIETALAALENRPMRYDPSEIARAGAFVSIGRDGKLVVERGFIRPEDEAPPITTTLAGAEGEQDAGSEPLPPTVERTVINMGAHAEPEDSDDDTIKPLPDRLVTELTAYRTLALQDALAKRPHVALTLLLHTLCCDLFGHSLSPGCLQVSVRGVSFPVQAPDLRESAPAHAIIERQAAWKADMPEEEEALWHRITNLDDTGRMALLAHCVSHGVNALREKADRYGTGVSASGVQRRIEQADRLARAVSLDAVEAGWRPTAENYLGRVPKARILEAVREARGGQSAQLIDHLKKADMASEAERLLEGTGWLPEPLRTISLDMAPAAQSDESEALPEFLTGEEDRQADDGAEADPHAVAAA
jgi:ParB family transcriptional regulator, chromosome partitioning protein